MRATDVVTRPSKPYLPGGSKPVYSAVVNDIAPCELFYLSPSTLPCNKQFTIFEEEF
jgi:hypothetical protein